MKFHLEKHLFRDWLSVRHLKIVTILFTLNPVPKHDFVPK